MDFKQTGIRTDYLSDKSVHYRSLNPSVAGNS